MTLNFLRTIRLAIRSTSRADTSRPYSALSLVVWLAVVLVAVKAWLLRECGIGSGREIILHPFGSLAVPLHSDMLLVLGIGLAGEIALLTVAKFPKLQRWIWVVWTTICTVCAVYAVVSSHAFLHLRTPL